MERQNKILLVILLCFCLHQIALGQNNQVSGSAAQMSLPAPLVAEAPLPSQTASLFTEVVAFVEEEPILLLVGGLMLFAGATTVKRKRARSSKQTGKSFSAPV